MSYNSYKNISKAVIRLRTDIFKIFEFAISVDTINDLKVGKVYSTMELQFLFKENFFHISTFKESVEFNLFRILPLMYPVKYKNVCIRKS